MTKTLSEVMWMSLCALELSQEPRQAQKDEIQRISSTSLEW